MWGSPRKAGYRPRSVLQRVVLLCVATAACGQPEAGVDERSESANISSKQWTLETLASRLASAGVHITHTEHNIRQPFMSVAAVRLVASDHSELQVFLYADHRARQHDTDRLDPHRAAPPHMMITWRLPPTLLVSGNMAIILLTEHSATRDHVKRAIAHGP